MNAQKLPVTSEEHSVPRETHEEVPHAPD